MPLWWKNTRTKDSGGLRLTDAGFQFITEELDLTTYDIPYPRDFQLTTNTIIWMDAFIDCPYYLATNGIIVTDEKKADAGADSKPVKITKLFFSCWHCE